jgi:hypothetical protein
VYLGKAASRPLFNVADYRDKLKACLTGLIENSVSQPTASADSPEYCRLNQQGNEAELEAHEKPEETHCRAIPLSENLLERPKRLTKLPKHLTDFVVSSVFRLPMTSQMVYQARTMDLVCEVCSKAFTQRHGLKYHLESKIDDPQHADYARRELQRWRSRGQYRTAERRYVRPSSESHNRERMVQSGSPVARQHLSSGNDEHRNKRFVDCSEPREQASSTPRVRSVVRAAESSYPTYSRPHLPYQRPFQRWSRDRHLTSPSSNNCGPARTLYVGTMRLARQILLDPTKVDPEAAVSLIQRVCPRMSYGQARVAAAAVFAGIHATMQAIFPHSGSLPMSVTRCSQAVATSGWHRVRTHEHSYDRRHWHRLYISDERRSLEGQ